MLIKKKGKAAIYVSNKTEKVSLNYDAGKKEGATTVTDQVKGKQVEDLYDLVTVSREYQKRKKSLDNGKTSF